MHLEPNLLLIALQAVPFFVTVVGLYFIIFRPMLAYLDERNAAMTEGRVEAEQLQVQVAERLAEYEGRLTAARREVAELRKRRREEASAAYESRVSQARAEAEAKVAAALREIDEETTRARAQLAPTADALAGQIAARVLGRALDTAETAR